MLYQKMISIGEMAAAPKYLWRRRMKTKMTYAQQKWPIRASCTTLCRNASGVDAPSSQNEETQQRCVQAAHLRCRCLYAARWICRMFQSRNGACSPIYEKCGIGELWWIPTHEMRRKSRFTRSDEMRRRGTVSPPQCSRNRKARTTRGTLQASHLFQP